MHVPQKLFTPCKYILLQMRILEEKHITEHLDYFS